MTNRIAKFRLFGCLVAFVTFLSGCSAPAPAGDGLIDPEGIAAKNCSVPRPTWKSRNATYNRDTVISLAAELSANAEADADRIRALQSAGANASFTPSYTNTVAASDTRTAEVSSALFEASQRYYIQICTVQGILKQTELSAQQRERLADGLIDLATSFRSIETEEKKSMSEEKS